MKSPLSAANASRETSNSTMATTNSTTYSYPFFAVAGLFLAGFGGGAQSRIRNTTWGLGRLAISLFEFFWRGKCRPRAGAKGAYTTVSVFSFAASLKGNWEVGEAPCKSGLLIQPRCQRASWTARIFSAVDRRDGEVIVYN